MADDQDAAESLDADKLGDDERVDEDDLGTYPPDVLQGANEYGLTAAEERWDEPLDERISRERPEPLVEELDRRARRRRPTPVDPDVDPSLHGVLLQPDDGVADGELDADVSPEHDRSPEDDAMHLEPPAR